MYIMNTIKPTFCSLVSYLDGSIRSHASGTIVIVPGAAIIALSREGSFITSGPTKPPSFYCVPLQFFSRKTYLLFHHYPPWVCTSTNYRPQMKFAKVMFSQVSVCPRGRGGLPHCMQGHPAPCSACWDTVNKRAVRIPLECILVPSKLQLQM